MNERDVDLLLRKVLAPTPGEAERVARRALVEAGVAPRGRRRAVAVGALATVVLLLVLAVLLRPTPQPLARTAAIYSVGDLVVGVPVSGANWIVGPGSGPESTAPMIVVVKGVNP